MQQILTRNPDSVISRWVNSRVVPLKGFALRGFYSDTLKMVQPDGPFEEQAMSIVDTVLSKNGGRQRQAKVLKAVLLGNAYWEDIKGAIVGPFVDQIEEVDVTDDFFDSRNGNTLAKKLAELTPRQEYRTVTATIADVSGTGQVDLGTPYVLAGLSVTGATPTSTFPATGLLEFAGGDIGKVVTISYNTELLYRVFVIRRSSEEPDGTLNVSSSKDSVIVSPQLADELSIPLITL